MQLTAPSGHCDCQLRLYMHDNTVTYTVPTYSSLLYIPNAGDSDYEGERFTVTFPAGVNVISFNVTIIDDAVAELTELFSFELEIPAASAAMGVIKGSPDTATVNIMDDEGMCNTVWLSVFMQCLF